MKIHAISLVAILLFGIVASSLPNANATMINCPTSMDGPQANAGAGTGSPGTGSATVTFDDATNQLSWNISWSGLLGAETLMHFHGAALPNQNAGVQVSTGVLGPPVVGNTVIAAGQAADLLSDLWYLNLHTTAFAGGEIRGQVLCETPNGNGGNGDRMVVGGEFIGVDTTSVLVAGSQNTAAWMIPVIVSAIGFAIVIARKF